MISAGNDIISLAEINPVRTKQPAFYKKFLTDTEVVQYKTIPGNLISFEHYVWLIWSAKEAAFKYLNRLNPQLTFSPSKFLVIRLNYPEKAEGWFDLDNTHQETSYTFRGEIYGSETQLTFESSLCPDHIHTVISSSGTTGKISWDVREIADSSSKSQSDEVRKLCLGRLSLIRFGTRFKIIKSDYGVPSIYDVDNGFTYPVSLSHHGNFVAYSFTINNSI